MVRIGVDHSCAFYKSWTPGCFFHRSKERYPLKFIRLRRIGIGLKLHPASGICSGTQGVLPMAMFIPVFKPFV